MRVVHHNSVRGFQKLETTGSTIKGSIWLESTPLRPVFELESASMNDNSPVSRSSRRRFQRGSLQKRKSGGCWQWIAFWREDRRRRSQLLGPCSDMSRAEALVAIAKLLEPVNANAGKPIPRKWTVGD